METTQPGIRWNPTAVPALCMSFLFCRTQFFCENPPHMHAMFNRNGNLLPLARACAKRGTLEQLSGCTVLDNWSKSLPKSMRCSLCWRPCLQTTHSGPPIDLVSTERSQNLKLPTIFRTFFSYSKWLTSPAGSKAMG